MTPIGNTHRIPSVSLKEAWKIRCFLHHIHICHPVLAPNPTCVQQKAKDGRRGDTPRVRDGFQELENKRQRESRSLGRGCGSGGQRAGIREVRGTWVQSWPRAPLGPTGAAMSSPVHPVRPTPGSAPPLWPPSISQQAHGHAGVGKHCHGGGDGAVSMGSICFQWEPDRGSGAASPIAGLCGAPALAGVNPVNPLARPFPAHWRSWEQHLGICIRWDLLSLRSPNSFPLGSGDQEPRQAPPLGRDAKRPRAPGSCS